MDNFTAHNTTKIHFGKGQIEQLTNEIPNDAKVLFAFGGGSIKSNGVYLQVKNALKDYQVCEFSGIEPNPHFETLMKAVNQGREFGATYVLAVGGGSVIDGCKLIAAAIPFQGDEWEIVTSYGANITSAVPLGCVLTLPATGSEMNNGGVITRASTQDKLPFHNDLVRPRFSILDPETTYSLPKRQIANGVVDAYVHILEQYATVPCQAKVQDRFAEGLLRTLIEEGPMALEEPENYDVRANIMWAATYALNGTLGHGVVQDWATHMIGHELTGLYGLDHAQTLAIVQPALWRYKKQDKLEKLAQYGARVFHLVDEDPQVKVDKAIDKTEKFFQLMGNKTRLADYGLGEEVIEEVVAKLVAHRHVQLGERGDIGPDAVREILKLAL